MVALTLDSIMNLIFWGLGIVIVTIILVSPFILLWLWLDNRKIRKLALRDMKGGSNAIQETRNYTNSTGGRFKPLPRTEIAPREPEFEANASERNAERAFRIQEPDASSAINDKPRIKLN